MNNKEENIYREIMCKVNSTRQKQTLSSYLLLFFNRFVEIFYFPLSFPIKVMAFTSLILGIFIGYLSFEKEYKTTNIHDITLNTFYTEVINYE